MNKSIAQVLKPSLPGSEKDISETKKEEVQIVEEVSTSTPVVEAGKETVMESTSAESSPLAEVIAKQDMKKERKKSKKEKYIFRGWGTLVTLFREQMAAENKFAKRTEVYKAMIALGVPEESARKAANVSVDLNMSGEGQLLTAMRSVFKRKEVQENTVFLQKFVQLCVENIPEKDIIVTLSKTNAAVIDVGEKLGDAK